MPEYLLKETKDGVCVITINRPDKLNALNEDVLEEMEKTLREIEEDKAVRVVVITGTSNKAFIAGADIKELKDLETKQEGIAKSRRGQRLFSIIENFKKPVIAGINGYALGGGLELAMSCDFRIASNNAKLGQPEINLAIIPGYGGTQRLTRLVGLARAKELIMTGRTVSAEEALNIGLVHKVVPSENLMEEVFKLADILKEKPPVALSACKKAIMRALGENLEGGFEFEAELFGELCETEDKNEGLGAFLEKRKPQFKGR